MASQPKFPPKPRFRVGQSKDGTVQIAPSVGRVTVLPPETQVDPAPLRQSSPTDDGANPTPGMYSRAYDAFAIGSAWLSQLARNEDEWLKREGSQYDLKLFAALLDDDVAFSAFQQRQLALLSRPMTVTPGDEKDPRSVAAADDFRKMLDEMGWDRVCRLMLFGLWFGYGVGEGITEVRQLDGRSLIWLSDIVVPDRAWFAFTNAGELRMRTPGGAEGIPVPDNKFWTFKVGGTHDFDHYGKGLAHWCYWPIWFKRNVLQFWAMYLEKFGQPTAIGFFQPGADQASIDLLLQALQAIGRDSAVALPAPPAQATGTGAGPDLKPQLIEAQRGGGADSYKEFVDTQNEAIVQVILSQSMTSKAGAAGIGSNQADVHKDVRDEVVEADSDGLHESFNATFPKWITLWNYGPDVSPPKVYRDLEDAEDLTAVSERDTELDGLGWRRTDESFAETYGEGYERKPEPSPADLAAAAAIGKPGFGGKPGVPSAANDSATKAKVANFAAGDIAPLYVSRGVTNAAEILAHYAEQGFTDLKSADDLHTTIIHSREAVDWFAMPQDYWGDQEGKMEIAPGGPRATDLLGPNADVPVLRYQSQYMMYRWRDFKEAGCSSDWPEFLPHITFANSAAGVEDMSAVVPYVGEIKFGPEIFARAKTDPVDPSLLSQFSAAELEAIDSLTGDMVARSEPIFLAFAAAMSGKIEEYTAAGKPMTPEGLRIAMLQALEAFPVPKFAGQLGVPFAAEHAGAAAGIADAIRA